MGWEFCHIMQCRAAACTNTSKGSLLVTTGKKMRLQTQPRDSCKAGLRDLSATKLCVSLSHSYVISKFFLLNNFLDLLGNWQWLPIRLQSYTLYRTVGFL